MNISSISSAAWVCSEATSIVPATLAILKKTLPRILIWSVAALVGITVRAELVEDFTSSPQLTAFKADERGASFAVVNSPGGETGKAAKFGFTATHAGFLEYYYARDVSIPGTEISAQGKLILHIFSEKPNALKMVAVRVKDSTGEIFHFMAIPANQTAQWQDLAIAINDGSAKGHWGGSNSAEMKGPLLLTGFAFTPDTGEGALYINSVSWESVNTPSADSKPAIQAVPTPQSQANAGKETDRYPLAEAHLMKPFWKSQSVFGEAVAFVKENAAEPATGTLLFSPKQVIRVRSSDGKTEYKQGQDYTVDAAHRRLILPPGSRIPFIERAALYKKKGDPQSIQFKVGDPNTYLFYAEAWFRGVQAEVDYLRDEPWTGYTPQFAGNIVPKTIAKLKRGETLNLCVTGDSISAGANASNSTAPYMPGYVTLLQRGLEKAYNCKVNVANLAKPSTTAMDGQDKISQVAAQKPDLVIIAFGMNDVAGHHPEEYAREVKGMIDAVRAANPESEFLLVSSILANPEWNWSPAEEFPKYRAGLAALTGPGIALADMTVLWTDMMKQKRYLDLTGNGINHPNDFGHRLYAQVLLNLLFTKAE